MLKLNWNGKECDGWVWDGKELKPKFGSSNATWIWDGKEFKPKYGSSNAAWIFDGKELKPKYGSSNNAFETNNAPIPVIAAKIIGLF